MIIGGVAIAAVILAILAAMFITRSIVRPLAQLAATATVIAEGNLIRSQKLKVMTRWVLSRRLLTA
jgi:nitrogen fixation/metabolism regulation signal transduction histidine kinase